MCAQLFRQLDGAVGNESDVLAHIREIKSRQGPLTMSENDRIAGVEVETFESKD